MARVEALTVHVVQAEAVRPAVCPLNLHDDLVLEN